MPRRNPSSSWNAEQERRLIEMHRREHTLEEMARELGQPLDAIEERLAQLDLTDDDARHGD